MRGLAPLNGPEPAAPPLALSRGPPHVPIHEVRGCRSRSARVIGWSEDTDEGALGFACRPLWQLDEPARAALALSRAQATQVYAGLNLWADAVMARLAEAQLVQDGTCPNAAAAIASGRCDF